MSTSLKKPVPLLLKHQLIINLMSRLRAGCTEEKSVTAASATLSLVKVRSPHQPLPTKGERIVYWPVAMNCGDASASAKTPILTSAGPFYENAFQYSLKIVLLILVRKRIRAT